MTTAYSRRNAPEPQAWLAPASVKRIAREVAEAHGVHPRSRRFGPTYAAARAEAFWRIRTELRIAGKPPSYPQIGSWFGRHHTTVLAAVRRVAA